MRAKGEEGAGGNEGREAYHWDKWFHILLPNVFFLSIKRAFKFSCKLTVCLVLFQDQL
jgi:hypothetical protein